MQESRPVFDSNVLGEMSGILDREILASLYSDYLASLQELNRALYSYDLSDISTVESLRLQYHKMKSSSAAVGALRLAEYLKHAESMISEADEKSIKSEVEILQGLVEETENVIRNEVDSILLRPGK